METLKTDGPEHKGAHINPLLPIFLQDLAITE